MCASVSPGVPVLHLFGITIKCEVPSFAGSHPYHPPSSLCFPCLLLSADMCLPVESWTGSCQSTVAPGRLPAEHFHPAKDFHWQVSGRAARIPSATQDSARNPTSLVSHTQNWNHNSLLSVKDQSRTGQQGHQSPCLLFPHWGDRWPKVSMLTIEVIYQDKAWGIKDMTSITFNHCEHYWIVICSNNDCLTHRQLWSCPKPPIT